MSDDVPAPLRYSEGLLEQLRASHAERSREELLELVCHLTRTYVLDAALPFDVPLPEREESQARARRDLPDAPGAEEPAGEAPGWQRFAQLIQGLKRRTGLPQFEGFALDEAGRAVLIVDNQKVTFGERVTVEFVPRRSPAPATPAPEPARPAPRPAAAPPRGQQPAAAEPPSAPPALDDVDHVVERFRGLELD